MISPLDHHLLRAYLDGEMDEATSTAFEIRLMERPDLAELVEADTLLGMGLKAALAPSAPAGGTAADVVPLDTARKPKPPRAGFVPARAAGFLAAAGVVLAVGVIAGRMTLPVRELPAAEPVTIVQVDTMRSAPDPGSLKLTVPRTGKVVLAVAFEGARRCASRVTITQPDRPPLEGEAAIESAGFANVVIDASRLAEGGGRIAAVCADGSARRDYSVEFAH